MHKSILIHQDNTVATTAIENAKTLDVKSDNIDIEIMQFIDTHISNQDLHTIFIKDSLSQNYLEFYGLLFAHHIRLNNDEEIKYLPIVIISDLNSYQLNKLTPLANICYSEGVYLVDNNLSKIQNILKQELRRLKKSDYHYSFLDVINIKPPANYDSKHSVANEWAIYQWSEFLEIEIDVIKANISSMLYFKYLQAQNIKEPLSARGIKKLPKKFSQEGKILFIDDEWAKGWGEIFTKQFESNPNFTVLKEEYKGKEQNEIIEMVIKSIDTNNLPDIIILDLRLCDNDFEFNDDKGLDKITGIQLIAKIHDINPAIQIILWTASGDSNILNKANNLNILGYVKKEYPGDRSTDVNNTIKIMSSLIDEGLSKKYLKEIWSMQEGILNLKLFDGVEIEIRSVFEILDSDMDNRYIYAMFAIFKVLEIIKEFYINDNAEFKDDNEAIKALYLVDTLYQAIEKNTFISNYRDYYFSEQKKSKNYYSSTTNKIRAVMFQKLKIEDKELYDFIGNISKKRNNVIHAGQKTTIVKDNILTWFKMLQTILEKIDKAT